MRRLPVLLLTLITACTAAQEVAPTPVPTASVTTETPRITTTTTPPIVSTTIPTPTTTLPPLVSLGYEEVATLDFPVQLVARPGESISYVATKDGRIWTIEAGGVSAAPILDIRSQVANQGERGLLAISLHPTDPTRLFVHYSSSDGGDTVVSEFGFEPAGSTVEPSTERVLLRLDQPAGNHNGGMIQFGPDGRLYLGLGDGGGGGDTYGNGQNTESLLGGLVAIEVDGEPSPQLFQYGLRNPWRFWIEGSTIYVADVGQGAFEEVSVAPLTQDVNYGWPITEGLHCFSPRSGCDTTGLTLPVIEVSHGDAGTCSITGGVVYRGDLIPELDGVFLFSDFCGGYLRGLDGETVM
ncbi:MAG: PQQ-dependent sugar dehydrogenase, partial [Acidimicrobiia bacterium]